MLTGRAGCGLETPFRETYALMPPGTDIVMYIVLTPFAVIFIYGLYRRLRFYGLETVWREVFRYMPGRLSFMVRYALMQRKVVEEKTAGLMHVMIYAGAIALFIGTALVFIDYDILRMLGGSILRGDFYLFYELSLDLLGLAFLAGLVILAYRRAVKREGRLRPKLEYLLTMAGLLFIGVTGYVLEGLRLSINPRVWGGFSFVGYALSNYMAGIAGVEARALIYQGLWWSHALVAFAMVAMIPYSNMLHIFTTFANTYFAQLRPATPGKMTTPFRLDEMGPDSEIKLGSRKVSELSWRQRLGLDACTDCGRCEAACPAYAAGTPLSPRLVVQKLKSEMWRGEDRDWFAGGVLEEDEIWACTTCAACVEACPVLISPLEYILEARRALTLEGKLEKRKYAMLSNLARFQNPYGFPSSERASFLEELYSMGVKRVDEVSETEYLYWIGCASLYDSRSREIVRSMVKILMAAGVSFAVLGDDEICTGDPARRVGEEGRFQELALANIERLKKLRVGKILVHCPHCFNTFKNEYVDLGLEMGVVHHSQLIGRLLMEGRIKLRKPLAGRITFHDSCYIGRINNIVEEPRQILSRASDDFVEMARRGTKSFCCGAGGSTYWYEVRRRERESVIRLEEAVKTGAETLALECPYCLQMFNDAVRIKGMENTFRLRDISEIVAECL
jgi:Fe-S oxidoreductase/nitrate reductase gamma subunit